MTARLCKLCGREFAPQQARSAYCGDACRKEGERRANALWARKDRLRRTELALRRREAALRMAPGGIPRDRAMLVYASESRQFGPVVTEWRGTVPTALRFLHMPENGGF
ncbi:MAG: hypothetical protein PUE68_12340 [Kiritimatiellae bacterium]|nr:hypothetical protein [Kiritimatiellia bacterium]